MVFYRCQHCGNIVVKLVDSGVPVVCCGEPMQKLEANVTDAAKEKHVPDVTADGNRIAVQVGQTAHPMTEEHHIAFIALETEKGFQTATLNPGEQPAASFVLAEGETAVAVYAWCNLHGLWKKNLSEKEPGKRVLVAYFSASGVTKAAAEKVAEAAGGDLFEIRPAVPYTDADLDWTSSTSRTNVEMADETSRPEMAEKAQDIGRYDTIFLGYPLWWGTMPRIVETFLESCDLAGKKLIPFATSGGSGLGKSEKALEKELPADVTLLPGQMVTKMSESEIADWVRSLPL